MACTCRVCHGVLALWTSLSLEYTGLSLPLGGLPWGVSELSSRLFYAPLGTCSFLTWFALITETQNTFRFSLHLQSPIEVEKGHHFFSLTLLCPGLLRVL